MMQICLEVNNKIRPEYFRTEMLLFKLNNPNKKNKRYNTRMLGEESKANKLIV